MVAKQIMTNPGTLRFAYEPGDADGEGAEGPPQHAWQAADLVAAVHVSDADWHHLEALLAEHTAEVSLTCEIGVVPADGPAPAPLTIQVHHVTELEDRLSLTGAAPGGQMQIVFAPTAATGEVTVRTRFSPDRRALPRDRLPMLELLARVGAGSRVRISIPSRRLSIESSSISSGSTPDHDRELLWAIRALDRIQRFTDAEFSVPEILTQGDERTMRRALRLLDGEEVSGRWDDLWIGFDTPENAEFARASLGPTAAYLQLTIDVVIEIAGHHINLGPAIHHFHEVRAGDAMVSEQDGTVQLQLIAGDDPAFDVRLLRHDAEAPPVLRRPTEMELRVHAGRWVASDGPLVIAVGDSPGEVVEWLRSHDAQATVWRVPAPGEMPAPTPAGL